MRRMLLAIMVVGSAQVLAAQTAGSEANPLFQAARALSVSKIAVPMSSEASGTVVLDAVVGATGNVRRVYGRRDIPSLTRLADNAVKGWKFSPATVAGNALASIVPVAITFRPAGLLSSPGSLPALEPPAAEPQAQFQPAGVTHAVFPNYPENTVISGSVELEANISANGTAVGVKVLSDLPPLTAAAQAVVPEWRFSPATCNGNPVPSRILLAFVFRPFVLPVPPR